MVSKLKTICSSSKNLRIRLLYVNHFPKWSLILSHHKTQLKHNISQCFFINELSYILLYSYKLYIILTISFLLFILIVSKNAKKTGSHEGGSPRYIYIYMYHIKNFTPVQVYRK